ATGAARDAVNRDEVVRQIRQQSGTECFVLSGEEEARLTFLGAASGIDWKGRWVLCDVGGGSTEIIAGEDRAMLSSVSLQLGSSRETRRFFHTDPPTHDEQQALRQHVRSVLGALPPLCAGLLVASGGTAYTAAVLCEKSAVADPFEVEGREVRREELEDLIIKVIRKALSERRAMPGLPSERAEVLPAGLLIYREMMDFFGVQKLKITLRDALFGAVLEKEWFS
ncbi:MAG: Ppx/GppA family phosphatase, partial [candidate division KSB1 bacterium]|nr:Ppx/GppA family phosphatase [candidate division KSB1 bacterium]